MGDSGGTSVRLVTVCTGNVARSVLLAAMLEALGAAPVRSRGTHVAEGWGVSARTLGAFVAATGLDPAPLRAHRSRQLSVEDLATADVVLCAEAAHVALARRIAPDAPAVTVGDLARATGDLATRLGSAGAPDPVNDVPDPAGGDQAAYDECARTLWRYARAIAPLL